MADTFDHASRPSLWERLAALAGHTTYREPAGGRSTELAAIPADHELCIAIGWSRRRDDPYDIGPDIAFDAATQSSRHQRTICELLAKSLAADQSRWRRVIRRNRGYLRIVAFDAYLRVVYGQQSGCRKPDGMDKEDWGELGEAAYRVLTTMADEAVLRAGLALKRA